MGSWRVKAAPTRSSCAGPWPAWRALSPAIEAGSPASVGRNSSPPGLKGCTHPRRCGVAAASVLRPRVPPAKAFPALTACWVGLLAHLLAQAAFTGTMSLNEAAHGRPVQHGQTAQRAGLQAAAVAGHVCSVQSCDRLRRRRCPRWAGSRAGRASRCPQGTVQAWAPPRTCEPFDPTEKTGLVRRRRTLPFLFYKYAVGLR